MVSDRLEEQYWKGWPKKVKALYFKTLSEPSGFLSTTGHEKSCGNPGGPPSKAKYSQVTDSGEVP